MASNANCPIQSMPLLHTATAEGQTAEPMETDAAEMLPMVQSAHVSESLERMLSVLAATNNASSVPVQDSSAQDSSVLSGGPHMMDVRSAADPSTFNARMPRMVGRRRHRAAWMASALGMNSTGTAPSATDAYAPLLASAHSHRPAVDRAPRRYSRSGVNAGPQEPARLQSTALGNHTRDSEFLDNAALVRSTGGAESAQLPAQHHGVRRAISMFRRRAELWASEPLGIPMANPTERASDQQSPTASEPHENPHSQRNSVDRGIGSMLLRPPPPHAASVMNAATVAANAASYALRSMAQVDNSFGRAFEAALRRIPPPQPFSGGAAFSAFAGTPFIHPQFRSKSVCCLSCAHCQSVLCHRGMKAILLGNTKVELFSTDLPPEGLELVNCGYTTRNCRCQIRDAACLTCGNIVGYHVTQPCSACLSSCNNGHFWMMLSGEISSSERRHPRDGKVLRWAELASVDRDAVVRRAIVDPSSRCIR